MRPIAVFLFLFSLPISSCSTKPKDNVRVILATTTSTLDSGLLDVLVPTFENRTGYKVQTVAVGTGAALKMAEEGNADVLLVHAPDAEKALMERGFGKNRYLVMHNDFLVVGPGTDPAAVRSAVTAAEAFARIARQEAEFVSRGDDSGTHKEELSIWAEIGMEPHQRKPAWYMESGQGMGVTLTIANEKRAYTLTDRATYLSGKKNLSLEILLEGDTALLNVYHVITVNPERWPETHYEGAMAFALFITGPEAQKVIGQFGVESFGEPLFCADAHMTDADLGLK
jgi:tungstate transport system substrate-binding protein